MLHQQWFVYLLLIWRHYANRVLRHPHCPHLSRNLSLLMQVTDLTLFQKLHYPTQHDHILWEHSLLELRKDYQCVGTLKFTQSHVYTYWIVRLPLFPRSIISFLNDGAQRKDWNTFFSMTSELFAMYVVLGAALLKWKIKRLLIIFVSNNTRVYG